MKVGMRRHLSPLTVECYQRWVMEFLRFCRKNRWVDGGQDNFIRDSAEGANEGDRSDAGWRHLRELGARDVERFLTYLAVDRRLPASSQNQACNAIVFLYRQVLADDLPTDHLGRFVAERSKQPRLVSNVLSENEVRLVAGEMPEESVRTKMLCTHAMNRPATSVVSPLDRIV